MFVFDTPVHKKDADGNLRVVDFRPALEQMPVSAEAHRAVARAQKAGYWITGVVMQKKHEKKNPKADIFVVHHGRFRFFSKHAWNSLFDILFSRDGGIEKVQHAKLMLTKTSPSFTVIRPNQDDTRCPWCGMAVGLGDLVVVDPEHYDPTTETD